MQEKRTAWHFLKDDWHTGEGNLLVEIGKPIEHDGPLIPRSAGLHASPRIIDALGHARGSVITRVECGGPFAEDAEIFVSTTRTVRWGYNATEELRAFARRSALSVVAAWDPPQVVLDWLNTGNPELRSAAWSAAWSAAESAAWSAAASAAWSAARSAAWSAASAARSAASAAYSAASAARSAASAAWSVADSAARSAAASAARSAQDTMLEEIIDEGAWKRGML